jgi:hypothetical protein
MTKEQLRMQMLAGVITESEYRAVINEEIENEVFQQGIDLIKSEMERHINDVSNKEGISDQEKKRRINNIKFVVYDFLDPNTNGGARPSNDFQFNEDWWNSISPETDPYQFHYAASDLVRAAKGDTFGEKDIPLNESMIGGIVGIGAINQIPATPKTDYEMAFEHFLGKKYINENETSDMGKEELVKKIKNLGDFGFTGDKIDFKGLLITASTQEDEGGPYYFVYGEDDDSEDGIFQSTNPNEVAEFVLNY